MSSTRPARKGKKNKTVNKKNIGLVLLYLKIFKIFKILFQISIVIFTFYLIYVMYKSDAIGRLKKNSKLYYSKLIYNSICDNVELNGIEKSSKERVEMIIYNFCNLNDKLDLKLLLLEIKKDPWIKDINIKRKPPNTLQINIEEYLPFAMLTDGRNLYLMDENGTVIDIDENEKKTYNNLLLVAGEGAKNNIYSLFNLLSSNPYLFSRIKSALRIGNRRWNLTLDNGIVVQMPEHDPLDAWHKLDKLLSIKGAEIDLKVIDLRNGDKIFLEEI